ncbi:UNVERIFIED_CONTAM: hypothetical protein Slati_2129300 [Sesamum latifolium]|uniref:Uncharacterized protein n=1 Tax=Sesamum latifolium TaxID=2727402 RepID=A0AAW2WS40_9LAMI
MQLDTPTAGHDEQRRPGLSEPQLSREAAVHNMPPRQPATGAHSAADSSGSSNEPDSSTSTQHFMPGNTTAICAPNESKLKQNLGRSPLLNPHEDWILEHERLLPASQTQWGSPPHQE